MVDLVVGAAALVARVKKQGGRVFPVKALPAAWVVMVGVYTDLGLVEGEPVVWD